MRKRDSLYFSLLCLALGCVGPTERPKAMLISGSPEHVAQKNDSMGVVKTVKKGQAILSVKDFWVLNKFPNFIITDRPVVIKTENRVVTLPVGRLIKYYGKVTIDHVDYMQYLDAHDDDGLGEIYYVKPGMVLAPFLYIRDKLTYPTGLETIQQVTPKRFKFNASTVQEPMQEKGHLDYALLFNGLDAQGIHITYQEFAQDGSGHPVKTQNLTFPANSPYLRYQDCQIEVHNCTPDQIVVTVASD